MPAHDFDNSETGALIAYLRSLSPVSQPAATTDTSMGRRIFFGKGACFQCHMIAGDGGVLGPDLTRVGAARSARYLIESIREPSKELSEGMIDPNNHFASVLSYDTVIVVTNTGRHLTGIAKNEDRFSIQLLDTQQQIHLLLKRNLRSVTHERRSIMPAYTRAMLSDAELHDLVGYLQGQRGRQ